MKNLAIIVLIIINTFLAIFALVRTYKDKFSETSNNKTPFEIIFDITDHSKYDRKLIKTEHIKNKLYEYIYDQTSINYKYTRHLDWKQSTISSSNNSIHVIGTVTLSSNDNKNDYCIFNYVNIQDKLVSESCANNEIIKFKLISKSGIFEKYNFVTFITKENTRIYRFE